MKAAWYEKNGEAAEVLHLGEVDKPTAGPGQVLVRVYATGVNPSDTKSRAFVPLPAGKKRVIPHQDGSGVIETVGEGVSTERVGERVWMYEALHSGGGGCAAEFVAVPSANAITLPDDISFETGACLGVPALTAHRCVFGDGPVRGQTVLVTGGGGAVGLHAIQFAKHGGAKVIATVSREEQAQVAMKAGADAVIYRLEGDQAQLIRDAAQSGSGPAIDRAIEVAFSANLSVVSAVLKPNGIISTYSSDSEAIVPFWPMMIVNATVHFILVYTMPRKAHEEAIDATTAGLREGWLRPGIAARFPLEQIVAAHQALESGKSVGKVVVSV